RDAVRPPGYAGAVGAGELGGRLRHLEIGHQEGCEQEEAPIRYRRWRGCAAACHGNPAAG
ncbi:unnamed protein product, partial [Symbiodinium pilosum]